MASLVKLLAFAAAGSGCGRFDFADQPAVDGPLRDVSAGANHDEDGDGVPDVVDDCPCLADADQLDGDGDGVGDACDPEPALARQHLALFSPLTPDDTLVMHGSAWQLVGDDAVFSGGAYATLYWSASFSVARVTIGLDVTAVDLANPPDQIQFGTDHSGSTVWYYGELYQAGGLGPYAALSWFDGTQYAALTTTNLAAYPVEPVEIQLDVDSGAGMLALQVTTSGGPSSVFASAPQLVAADGFHFGVQNAAVAVHHLCIVTTD